MVTLFPNNYTSEADDDLLHIDRVLKPVMTELRAKGYPAHEIAHAVVRSITNIEAAVRLREYAKARLVYHTNPPQGA